MATAAASLRLTITSWGTLIDRLRRALGGQSHEIVVDDDSPDGTWQVARHHGAGDPAVRVIRRIGERGLASASSTAWPRPRATKTSTDCMFRDEGSGRSWRYPAAWPRRDLSNGRAIGDEEAVTKESSAHRCGPSRRRRDCGAGEQGCAIVGVGDRCDRRDHGANSQADC
ncbi:MAG: glycosyltransferase [Acidimicrobiaceae bacterium]|nr:glycosyltransferase [Acidimicrobiaceae bacterium]